MTTKVRELIATADIKGNFTDKLAKFGLAMNGIKAGLDLVLGAVKAVSRAVASLTVDLATQGDEAAKSAKNLGITAEAMQELDFAATLAGQSMTDVRTAIQRMQKGLNDARQKGTGPFADGLKQIGILIEEFDALEPDEQFQRLAQALSELEDDTTKAALAQDFFGRGGKTLIPLLNEGAAGIKAMRAEFRELGGGFTNDGAAAAEEFIDSQARLKVVVDSVKIAIGQQLFPVIQELVDGTRAWIQENRELVKVKVKEFIDGAIKFGRRLVPVLKAIGRGLTAVFTFAQQLTDNLRPLADALGITTKGGTELGDMFSRIEPILSAAARGLLGVQKVAIQVATAIAKIVVAGLNLIERVLDPLSAFKEEVGEAGRLVSPEGDISARDSDVGRLVSDDGSGPGRLVGRGSGPGRLVGGGRRARGSRGAAAPFQADQEDVRRFKEIQKGLGRGFDKVAGVFRKASAMGRATAKEIAAKQKKDAEKAARNAGKRRGGGKPKKDEALSDQELLKLIERAASSGESLTGLIGDRKLSGNAPPVITVTINNFDIDQQIAAPVTVNGVPGQSAGDIAAMVEKQQREIFQKEMRKAVQAMDPAVAR